MINMFRDEMGGDGRAGKIEIEIEKIKVVVNKWIDVRSSGRWSKRVG